MAVNGRPVANDVAPRVFDRLAHDLRGPLSPLQTAVYLLRHDDVDEQRRLELLDIIDRQTTRLTDMLQEASDWNHAQHGRLLAHREVAELAMILEVACAPPYSVVGRELRLDTSLQAACIDGDAQRLAQMFGSLVAYARVGADSIAVEGTRDGKLLEVTIRSRGGQAAAVTEELLAQPDPAPFDGGLGLRLPIATAIAQAHGGSLRAFARDDGIEFRIELPIAS